MKSKLAILICALGIATPGLDAIARGPGGGGGFGGGMGHSTGSAPHASDKGYSNANAPFTGSQQKGFDRAQERMSDQGLSNEKATDKLPRRPEVPGVAASKPMKP